MSGYRFLPRRKQNVYFTSEFVIMNTEQDNLSKIEENGECFYFYFSKAINNFYDTFLARRNKIVFKRDPVMSHRLTSQQVMFRLPNKI